MWLKMQSLLLVGLIAFYLEAFLLSDTSAHRQKRLAYTTNSCTGVLVAIAIPLNLANRNVFVSYNFEANYNMPTSAPDLIPGPLKRLELVDKRSFGGNKTQAAADRPTFLSRAKVYKLIEHKISGMNLNGGKCLLRLICEAAVAKESLFKHDGVLGDLLQLLLTPSSTTIEQGPSEYYDAELTGRKGSCDSYKLGCAVNLLDYFTSVFAEAA